jgi:hypothetical protein
VKSEFLTYSARCTGDEDDLTLERLGGEVLIWVNERIDTVEGFTAVKR